MHAFMPWALALVTAAPVPANDFPAVRDATLAALRENCSRLTRAHLVWTHRVVEDGFTPGRELSFTRRHEMWLDGERVAVLADGDRLVDRGGKQQVERIVSRAAFNGSDFRRRREHGGPRHGSEPTVVTVENEPDFHKDENWLRIVSWGRAARLERRQRGAPSAVTMEAAITDSETGKRLVLTLRNTKAGTRVVTYYNLERGSLLEREEWFDAEGHRYFEMSQDLRSVVDGVWMPVHHVGRTTEAATGRVTLLHEYSLELQQCSFGEEADVDPTDFEIPVTPDDTVIDSRAGAPAPVMYTGADQVVPRDEMPELLDRSRRRDDGLPLNLGAPSSGTSERKSRFEWLLIGNVLIATLLGLSYVVYRARARRRMSGSDRG